MKVKGVTSVTFVLLGLSAGIAPAVAQQSASGATPQFSVNGFTLGARVPAGSAALRGFQCNPSELFSGYTWCQRITSAKKVNTAYSILHAADGTIVYSNQSSEPSPLLKTGEVKQEIANLSKKLGAQPTRTIDMPRRPEFANGVIAIWGDVVLEPLDAPAIAQLATGKSPRRGLLIDFLGNLNRSASAGMPVYRFAGGRGFVWAASYGKKGGGALRSVAVDATRFAQPSGQTPVAAEPQPAPQASVEPAQTDAQAPTETASQATASSQPEQAPPAPPAVTASPSAPATAAQSPSAPATTAQPSAPATAAQPPSAPAAAARSQSAPAAAVQPPAAPAATAPAAPAAVAQSPSPPATAAQPSSPTAVQPSSPVVAAASPPPATSEITQSPGPASAFVPPQTKTVAELTQTIETLKGSLASSTTRIAELEKANADATRAVQQAEQARVDAENARRSLAQASAAPQQTAGASQNRGLQILAYSSLAGLTILLAINAFVLLRNRMLSEAPEDDEYAMPEQDAFASAAERDELAAAPARDRYVTSASLRDEFAAALERDGFASTPEPDAFKPDVPAPAVQPQAGARGDGLQTLPTPSIVSENLFGLELEREVASLNALDDEPKQPSRAS
jgi:hypothetical protein